MPKTISDDELLILSDCVKTLKSVSSKLALNRMTKTQDKIDDICKKINLIVKQDKL